MSYFNVNTDESWRTMYHLIKFLPQMQWIPKSFALLLMERNKAAEPAWVAPSQLTFLTSLYMPISCFVLSQRAGKSWQGDSRLKIHSQGSVSEEHAATAWASWVLPEERNSIHFLYLALSWPWEATLQSFMVNKCHEWGQMAAVVIDVGILYEEHPKISLSLPYRKIKSIWMKSSVVLWSQGNQYR